MKIQTMKSLLVIPVFVLAFFQTSGNARPLHDVSLVASPTSVYEGQSFSVYVDYDAYDPGTPLVHVRSRGVGVRVYFQSSKVAYLGYAHVVAASYWSLPIELADESNDDNDALTDRYVQMAWYEINDSAWPEAIPGFIAVLDFVLLTPADTALNTGVRNISLAGGYVATGVAITGKDRIPGDFDCNGVVSLNDLIPMLRLLSGTDVSAGTGCPRPLGDFDGNGKTGLGDCVGILQAIAGIR